MADSSDENKQDNNGKSSHYSIVPDDSSESDSTEVGSDQHRGERELDWNATYARNVEELLLSKLRAVFEGAIKQIVELGYSEDVAKMALSRKALYIQEGDPVSNIVNATLNVLKGKYVTTSDISFGNIQHLVFYTLSEMIADLRKARPSLTAGEALWSLLMCDLNFSLACTSEEFENVDSNGESFTSPSIPQNSPNNERVKSEEENDSLPSVSGRPFETSGDVCKGGSSSERHNVKEIKSLTQMFHHMKKAYRACEKGSLMIDKKIEPPSDIHNQQMKSFSSNTKSKQGVCASDATCYLSTNTASTLPAGGSSATLPDAVFPSSIVNPNISASDTISKPKSQRNPFDAQKIPDYCAGIPYDESMGKYVPRDQNDEAILELVRRAHLLQGKLQRWINWANRKITHVTVRAVKLQPELKMLKKEKQEAEKDAILFQENAVKKISEMDNATENTKKQIDSTTTDALLLEAEYTMLHEELVAERLSLEKSMTRHQQAIEREQRALTRAEFLESENALHRDDLERDKQKLSKLQQQLDKEKILLTRVEVCAILIRNYLITNI
ncbi:hypothetical protein Lalb_Chr02g0142931 [Lupinus albus]|uniref:PIR2-like helical domain-containing protein n=1 Tax=Lupinus albus TaxID=3870 RepID=A0A6A4QUC6_LUPAL|nr:hypothetical protein Lalb_Chr02g0142931 [Lupinus albus]